MNNDTQPIIVRFLEQKCLGYSRDFSRTFYQDRVILLDGTQAIVYTTVTHGQINIETHSFKRMTVDVPVQPYGGGL
jgi:hypothetical protein